ncbi:MAG: autotransporter outer membrane beta-barrel domain-containing protein [Mailhella sp.]|nr:autotransporter outer membrane beta-barrel domain-containing protein [Mailhella sp.]
MNSTASNAVRVLDNDGLSGSKAEVIATAGDINITSGGNNGVYNSSSGGYALINATGNVVVNAAASAIKAANTASIEVKAGNELSIIGTTNAIELSGGSTATLSADTYNITGDILIDAPAPAATRALTRSTPAPSKLVFNGGAGQVDGNIDAENGGVDLNNGAEIGLADGSDNSIGELGGNGAFLLNDKNTKLAVNELADGSTAKAKATPKLNDELSGNAEEFKKQLKLGNNDAGVDVDALFGGMEEGLVAGAVDASGRQSKNRIMDAALKQASVTTIALDKILTNDVRKRLGDIRSDKNQTGVWMRWDGGKLKGEGLTNNFNTIQIGGDTKVGTNCRIGVAGSFTHGDADFARGNAELEGFSFALYSTWMGENGMFADIVTRLGHFSNEMNVEGRKGDMDNRVFSLSGEYGWRFDLCKQFFLEPQVELAYTYVSSDDLQLDTAHYEFDSVNSLTGRAGLVAGWNLPDDMGSVYARASVLQQFMGDAKIIGANGGKPITQEIDGNDTWMEYGIGANIKLTEKTYIWADVERTAGADLDEEWRGTVGLRYSF